MDRSTRQGLLIAAALAAVFAVGGVVYASTSTPTATPPSVQLPPQFINGHSYRLRVRGAAIAQIDPRLVSAASVQQGADSQAPGRIKVTSAAVSGDALSVNFDFIGPTQNSKVVPQEVLDQIAARGLSIVIADRGVTGNVGGGAVDHDAIWHAWKQNDNDPNDTGVDVYVGDNENYAKTAADYWATQNYRTGYYSTL